MECTISNVTVTGKFFGFQAEALEKWFPFFRHKAGLFCIYRQQHVLKKIYENVNPIPPTDWL